MSDPHYFKHNRVDTEDTVIVASVFVLVALALGALIYAYDGTGGMQTASNLPPMVDGSVAGTPPPAPPQ